MTSQINASAEALVMRLLRAQYRAGGDGPYAFDCWGLVCQWYLERLGVVLNDRADHEPGPDGMAAGFDAKQGWVSVQRPADDDLIVMRRSINGRAVEHGHCGIFWRNQVLHAVSEAEGIVLQSYADRRVSSRVTAILRRSA